MLEGERAPLPTRRRIELLVEAQAVQVVQECRQFFQNVDGCPQALLEVLLLGRDRLGNRVRMADATFQGDVAVVDAQFYGSGAVRTDQAGECFAAVWRQLRRKGMHNVPPIKRRAPPPGWPRSPPGRRHYTACRDTGSTQAPSPPPVHSRGSDTGSGSDNPSPATRCRQSIMACRSTAASYQNAMRPSARTCRMV